MTSTDEISSNDTQFIFECLKNLDTDRQVNLNKVADAMGYSNVFSVGNRLRSLRNRYGFANFDGKATTGKGSVGEPVPVPVSVPVSKRGRPRVKSIASKGDVAVEVTNTNTANNKRKRSNDANNEDHNDAPKQPSRRKPATTERDTTANGHNHGHGPGKTSRTHFARFPTPSKKRKKQAEATTDRDRNRRLDTPSRRIFHVAAQTIKKARAERHRIRNGEKRRSGLKLVFKVED